MAKHKLNHPKSQIAQSHKDDLQAFCQSCQNTGTSWTNQTTKHSDDKKGQ